MRSRDDERHQTEHERRVAQEGAKRTGRSVGEDKRIETEPTPYEAEVTAERTGRTADEVREEEREEPRGEAARWKTG